MQISISTILSVQLVLVLALATGVFVYTILVEQQSVSESIDHGQDAVSTCFDQYLESIQTSGESFVKEISWQLTNHIKDVVDDSEAIVRGAANAVERTRFMEDDVMINNSFHGSQMLPSLSWMMLGPLEQQQKEKVVDGIVVASMNSTEEFNTWVWWALGDRNPNPVLDCDFYYYRNATNASSSIWCVEDLYETPDMPSPSIYPHLYSPAIVKLQNASACDAAVAADPDIRKQNDYQRPLVWMPLDFFVYTNNHFALTSVVAGIYGPDGSCKGLAAANVRFSWMSQYLTSLVETALYSNLSIALIETESGQILGTSFGSSIYKVNQTTADGLSVEQELPASLETMEHPLAAALKEHIADKYKSIEFIPTPLTESVTLLDGQEYFLSFSKFSRPRLNLTVCVFLPHVSITGPTERQRDEALIYYETSADELESSTDKRLLLAIIIGVLGLVTSAIIASLSSVYISLHVRNLVNFMEHLRSKISELVNKESSNDGSTENLCEPLPADFFPVLGAKGLRDLNKITAATEELCSQLLETWNAHKDVFRKALEQRQFTASIAHDIRNPLHGVLGIVGMMQTDIDAHKDKLPLLSDTLMHMSVLLNDMVDLSKIQGGKVTHTKKSFDVWDTINEVLTLYQNSVVSGGGEILCTEKFPIPLAYADPVHVQRILTNFVSNAVKYAAGSEIQLRAMVVPQNDVESLTFVRQIESHFTDHTAPYWAKNTTTLEYDHYIVLACLDKGRGIPSSKLDQVFEAYQQTRADDTYQGAGLGLAIAKGLAVEMGGGVGVQAQEGSGSLFWVVVPCLPATEQLVFKSILPRTTMENGDKSLDKSFNTVSTSVTSTAASADYAGCRVLIVDDTNLNLMLLRHFLSKLDITAEMSSSALDGLSRLQEDPEKFSLIISDFHMPDMTGGDFCLNVRMDPRLCHLPFIISSGNHLNKEEKAGYKIDDTLMKPFTFKQLKEIIERHIHRPSAWSSSSDPDSVSPSNYDEDSNNTADSFTNSNGVEA